VRAGGFEFACAKALSCRSELRGDFL
jgi:hypothetical protein